MVLEKVVQLVVHEHWGNHVLFTDVKFLLTFAVPFSYWLIFCQLSAGLVGGVLRAIAASNLIIISIVSRFKLSQVLDSPKK